MPEIETKKATLNQLRAFADQYGVDYSDIGGANNMVLRNKLLARLRQTQLITEDHFELAADPDDPSVAKELKPKYAPAPTEVPEAGDPAIDAGRNDPRNPFPGKYVGDKIELYIPAQDPKFHPGGDQPVDVAVNGRTMLIPRGEWCKVPYEFAVVLANAKSTVYESNLKTGIHRLGENYQYPFNSR